AQRPYQRVNPRMNGSRVLHIGPEIRFLVTPCVSGGIEVNLKPKNRLRSPDELVGTLSDTDLPPPRDADTDALLVRALRERDETAFETLIDRLYAPMIRVASSYVRSREEAEEVVQDTWLAVLRGIDRFEGRSSLKTWIFRILVNRARTRASRESRSLPFSALEEARSRRG